MKRARPILAIFSALLVTSTGALAQTRYQVKMHDRDGEHDGAIYTNLEACRQAAEQLQADARQRQIHVEFGCVEIH
jgi:hypothetical protein